LGITLAKEEIKMSNKRLTKRKKILEAIEDENSDVNYRLKL